MGHTATTINGTGGICPIRDVCAVLGIAANGDWGYICSNAHGKTNMWALFKPVRHTCLGDITKAQRKAAGHGLSLAYIASNATAAQDLLNALQASIPSPGAWTYLPPRTGTDWQRMDDWLDNENPGQTGYNHAAKPMMSGFGDITIFDDEFGNEAKTWSFNFKWGASTYQGTGTVTGIEIPLTELMDGITDGTWRIALLIFFPQSDGKYLVAAASSPGAIPSGTNPSSTEIGNMMVRPTGTAQLNNLMRTAYNAGIKQLTAIPVLAKGLSRGGSGTSDKWSAGGSSMFIGMPLGEKIAIKLSAAIDDVSVSFNSITLKYIGGSSSPAYTLVPVGSSGQNEVALGKPSATNSTSCQVTLDFTLTATGKSQSLARANFNCGVGGKLSNGSATKLEKWSGSAWTEVTAMQLPVTSGRFRLTVLDAAATSASALTPIMAYIEGLPRRTPPQTVAVTPCLSIKGVTYNASNHFNHRG